MSNNHDYSSVFYINPLPSLVFALENLQILDVNQAAIDHYGYSKEEFLRLTILDLQSESVAEKLVKHIKDLHINEGNIDFGNVLHKKKNGQNTQLNINGHRAVCFDRECMLLVCQYLPKEEEQLKESIESLRHSEINFKTIFEIASLGIIQVDPSNGQIMLVNQYYETITGYKKDELLKMSFIELTHPDDRDEDWKVFTKAMRGEGEYRNDKRYIRKDGTIVWVRLNVAFIRDNSGNPIRTVAICEDITAQKEEEHRLKLLESVITNTTDSVLITEAEPLTGTGPRIIYVNEAFTKMTGYTSEEVIGKTPRILQGPNSNKEELARLSKALKDFESCEITTINYKKNGEEFWINFSVTPVANQKGHVTHFIAIERDVTANKQKEIENELLSKISLDFAFENDLIESVHKLCKTVSSYANFDFVELWLPNIEDTHIKLIAHNSATPNSEIFYETSKGITLLNFDEGLAGRVWKQKSIVLWDEVGKNDDFVRKEAAQKAKITSVLGIPLLVNNDIVGVLVIASQYDAKYLNNYAKLLNQLKRFIGSEITRKKLEYDLNYLFDAVPDIICITDLKGKFLKINKSGCELIGYEESEILHSTFEKFVHPEDKDKSFDDLKRLNEGNKTYGFENRYITKSGELIWLSWTSNSNLYEGLIYATARNITEERSLRELKTRVAQLARIGSWELDVKSEKLYWSDMVHEIHETNAATFAPDLKTGSEFYREDYRSMVTDAITSCFESNSSFDFEAILITAKNNERWVRVIGNSEIIEGQHYRVYGSVQDIHKRKLSEIEFQKSLKELENYKFALDESAIIAFTDKKGVISFVNDNFCKISQYSKEELIGKTHKLINSNYHSKEFFIDLWKTISSEQVWRGEIKNRAKDGSYYWVDTTITPFFNELQQTIQYLAIRFDITERKFAIEEINKANERFEMATTATNDAIWDWDILSKTIIRSQGIQRFFGEDTPEIINQEDFWLDKFHPDDQPKLKQSIEAAFENKTVFRWEMEYRIMRENQKICYVLDKGKIVRDDKGVPIRMVGAMTDITDRKTFEQQLLKLNDELKQHAVQLELKNEELEQFAFVASHDLQEPLRMVSSFMDLLKIKYNSQLDEKALEYIHFASDGAKRMKQIILDLLDYSRAGKLTDDDLEMVDLNEVIADFSILRRKIIEDKSVKINTQNLPAVRSYKSPLIQVLHCLLDNAIKYSVPDKPVVITIVGKEFKSNFQVQVQDNGIGIDSQFFEKIFVIFQRLHNKEVYSGTGIGLSIAKKNIESLGGNIWLESTPGEGSIFYFTIPKRLNKKAFKAVDGGER